MKIEILGDGCSKCDQLKMKVRQALDELDLNYEIQSLSDPAEIAEFHTLSMPQLVINGHLNAGKTHMSVDEIKELISISGP